MVEAKRGTGIEKMSVPCKSNHLLAVLAKASVLLEHQDFLLQAIEAP